jgi:hypothetical protein
MTVSLSPPSGDGNSYYVYPGNTYYIYPGIRHDYDYHHGDDHGFDGGFTKIATVAMQALHPVSGFDAGGHNVTALPNSLDLVTYSSLELWQLELDALQVLTLEIFLISLVGTSRRVHVSEVPLAVVRLIYKG